MTYYIQPDEFAGLVSIFKNYCEQADRAGLEGRRVAFALERVLNELGYELDF